MARETSRDDNRPAGVGQCIRKQFTVYVNVNLSYISPVPEAEAPAQQMPEKTYSISDLASEFGVTTRTIRFYEEKGLVTPRREGQKRLYNQADRVRIKLILRGKRIGMTLDECVEVIDMYDPEHNNAEQLHSLIARVQDKRARFEQQRRDIDEMLKGLDEVQALCESALAEAGAAN